VNLLEELAETSAPRAMPPIVEIDDPMDIVEELPMLELIDPELI
jgi:hypothetical protein